MPKKKKSPHFTLDKQYWTAESVYLGRGHWIYTCWSNEVSQPIGFIWGENSSNKIFFVEGCYVPDYYRRNGIMRFLHDYLMKTYNVLMTGEGSKEGGLKFITNYGYKNRKHFGWSYIKPKK